MRRAGREPRAAHRKEPGVVPGARGGAPQGAGEPHRTEPGAHGTKLVGQDGGTRLAGERGGVSDHPMSGPRFETWLDKQIREAEERGAFDDLPGAGKPIPDIDAPHDEMWWVKSLMKREGVGVTPPAIALRRKIDDILEHLGDIPSEDAMRDVVADLNAHAAELRRRPHSGPAVPLPSLDVEDVVARWRAARADAE